ncbi:hypothetical protein J2X72_001779 [Phyllobacterium sp. 1468]|uniref:hypothetical protein n=1 Tax=Phyllobacterium sp. 1468 TaxID=2817759 RepID=UPI00285776CF|nr:hypothetical protein [Phyllobacterium sp. 1468]MDR6632995.1 hypothetical protein [Phyllobacterium sp. 1468]
MRDFEYDLSQVYHHRFRVEQAAAELKAMRQAPPNTYPWRHIRAAEHNYNAWRSHLSMAENILRKFHPDQPRVPAGNPDGGQWTDGGGGSRPGSNDPLSPARTDFSGTKPGINPGALINPVPTSKPGSLFGRGAGPAIVGQLLRHLLDSDPLDSSFKGTPDEAAERYNWLLQNAPKTIVPALQFTPHEFEAGQGPKPQPVVVPLLREQVEGACPLYGAVQKEANLATQEAIKRGNYRSASEFGTEVHTIMKDYILAKYPESLIPERSYLKYAQEIKDNNYSQDGVRYGLAGSLRLDVLEDVGNGVVCVYDLKTAKSGLTPARMREIGQSVHKNFKVVKRIIIIPIQPWLSY